jgi:hypothetical protein
MPIFIWCCSHTIVPMVRRGPVSLAFALLAIAAVLTWANLAVAAVALCLNETPVLASGIGQAVPASDGLARLVLATLGPLGVDGGTLPPSCSTAAPARALAVAGLAYLVGIWLLDRSALPSAFAWGLVLGVALIVRLGMFFMPALYSSDILDYASHGRVASIHQANPYLLVPAQFTQDPYSGLGAWPQVVTVYGPLWTRIDAALTGLLANASVVQVSFAYKLIGVAADALCIALIGWITFRWRKLGIGRVAPVVAVAMWAWNPLVNLEVVGSAHNEGLMSVFVLLAFALMTLGVQHTARQWLWFAALVSLWIGALIKFVPAAIECIVALVWLRCVDGKQRLWRALILVATLLCLSIAMAGPWLDSPAVAAPLVGLANGGQRVKDAWQDAPAAWLTVRVVPLLGVPDDPATLRMDVARVMVWGLTRAIFAVYVLIECVILWRRTARPTVRVLYDVAGVAVRVLLLALLLYTTQVYAWYFLWPLPVACLLGPRDGWSRAAVVFGLTFLPAYYLREFEPYGVFEMPIYAEIGLVVLGVMWIWTRRPRLAPQY